ncbi:hypothetical protein MTO96_004230 [Rhipicephalus appendiculatus]
MKFTSFTLIAFYTTWFIPKNGNVASARTRCMSMPSEDGDCEGHVDDWYYSREDGKCRNFITKTSRQTNLRSETKEKKLPGRLYGHVVLHWTVLDLQPCALRRMSNARLILRDLRRMHGQVPQSLEESVRTNAKQGYALEHTLTMKIGLCILLTYYVVRFMPSHARAPPRCRRMPEDEDECPVKVSIQQWYYNIEEQRCKNFMFGDCPDNSNKFETEKDCKAACITPAPLPTKPPKVQKEPPKWQPPSIQTPPKRQREPPRRRPPKPSRPPNIYGGGGQGGQQKRPPGGGSAPSHGGQKGSRQNMCSVMPIEGDCQGSMLWYFDRSKVRCRRLKSGLCKGTHEFFTSKKECDNRCKGRPGSQRRRCFMVPDEGDCEDVEKWYYSPKRDKCRIFREGDCILNRPGGAGQVNGTGGGTGDEAGRNKTEGASTRRLKPNCGVRARKRKVCEDFTDKWWFDGYFRICNIVKEGECPSHGSFFDSCEDCMSRCNRRDARRCVYIEEKIRKQRGR